MRRIAAVFTLMLWAVAVAAQDQPRLDATLDKTEVIPGQPVVLRIKILVPTWMPTPPVYPGLEQPDLMVRLPDRATTPISERIDGETWSGTSRAYRLYPLAAGTFALDGKAVTVTYADPDGAEPLTVDLPLPAIRIAAQVPDNARDLSPFIAAEGFTLEQSFEGADEGEVQVGGAVTRIVTARIEGTTPILIPTLLPEPAGGPLRAYADEPRVEESENRGRLSGTRTERVSYVAQSGGPASLPALTVRWLDLGSGQIETATLPGLDLSVADPPPPPPDPLRLAGYGAGAIALILFIALAQRRLAPRLELWRAGRRAAWEASEPRAAWRVRNAIGRCDLGATDAALDDWCTFHPGIAARPEARRLSDALHAIGRSRFSGQAHTAEDWTPVRHRFTALRHIALARNSRPAVLPPLNPQAEPEPGRTT